MYKERGRGRQTRSCAVCDDHDDDDRKRERKFSYSFVVLDSILNRWRRRTLFSVSEEIVPFPFRMRLLWVCLDRSSGPTGECQDSLECELNAAHNLLSLIILKANISTEEEEGLMTFCSFHLLGTNYRPLISSHI